MGWIQIKMGHSLAQNGAENGAALAPFRANGAHGMGGGKLNYPARACAARGKVISRGWWCPKEIYSFFGTNLLSLKILTFRALFQHRYVLIEFNGLWYSLAARQVFVAIAKPDSLSFG